MCVLVVAVVAAVVVRASGDVLPCQFYISTTGADSNPGTSALPFATLAGAINVTTLTLPAQSTPAVFCYKPGQTYVSAVVIQPCPSPYPQIVARSDPPDVSSVTISGESLYAVCSAFKMSHVTMDNKITVAIDSGLYYPPSVTVQPDWGCEFSNVRVDTGAIKCAASYQSNPTFYGVPFLVTDSVFDGSGGQTRQYSNG